MKRHYRSRRDNGGTDGENLERDYGENCDEAPRVFDCSSDDLFKRPPGLRGKAIGLFYRDRARKRRQEAGGHIGIRLNPSVSVPPDILKRVQECLEKFNQPVEDEKVCNDFKKRFTSLLSMNFEQFIESHKQHPSTAQELFNNDVQTLSQKYKSELIQKQHSDENYKKRFRDREKLPTMQQRKRILDEVECNQVVLIVGSTGCGKTTQVPQILLDNYIMCDQGAACRIVCTEPRRIAAITVAERVAYERAESLGSTVGYQIRLESRLPRNDCSILYCTTGIILQKMQANPLLYDINVLILDEIHERSVETDLLMALLKKILPKRTDLKVILMSATVDEHLFCEYFNNCCTLYIKGTIHPVEVLYLEDILQETGYKGFTSPAFGKERKTNRNQRNQQEALHYEQHEQMIKPYLTTIRGQYDSHVLHSLRCLDSEGCDNIEFLEHLIFYICENKPPGAILVFLPGYDKISKLHKSLQTPTTPKHRHLTEQLLVFPLHSLMPTVSQKSVFAAAPKGKRKVILSTIIAETSVTIDDVVYVINTGRTKISDYDRETNIQTLQEVWVSKANSQQRKGRAGRVQPGVCYNLFSRAREGVMLDVPPPEIVRTKLEGLILNLKLLHITDPFEFLSTLINSPDPRTIQNGVNLLKRIDALDGSGQVTPLGVHLAHLPIDPQMGKMILMASMFSCIDPISSAAAGISFKTPFYTPLNMEQRVDRVKRHMSNSSKSDHLLLHYAIQQFREANRSGKAMEFCYDNFLSYSTVTQLESMKQQFAELLKAARFTESSNCLAESSNINSHNVPLLRAIIASGLYPNVAFLAKVKQIRNRTFAVHKMSTPEDNNIKFHPSSVNSGEPSFNANFFVYFQKQKTNTLYILDATMVFPMALLIFGDGVRADYTSENIHYITVAKQYYFKCDVETAATILRLRSKLELLLQKKALHPSPIQPNSSDNFLIKAIQILLSLDDVGDHNDIYLRSEEEEETESTNFD